MFAVLATSARAQTPDDPAVTACKSTGLLALQEKSKDISDLVVDMESVAVRAETKVEDVHVKAAILGEAYTPAVARPERLIALSACSARRARCS
ncbi:hypothetical protein [Mesorhizobium sp. WSM4313]|uniref:hypothetical protein n=1 Tax=Mesorhizobium sp. WSM4313 TaxID=2029412 RepID=UPI001FDA387A|nr:hypothetical protein [Mesorhizobium sp. WSM4313]